MFRKVHNVHFVGIGGSGMSGIAEVLLNLGYEVSGSDLAESEATRRLLSLGAEVGLGHDPARVRKAHVVVVSTAVPPDNPEVQEAQRLKIPVVPRAEMLVEIARLKYTVAVAGTHGKTTTTSMVGAVLVAGGLDPTLVVGGRLRTTGTGARLGQGEYLVAEADESDGSFLKLTPTVAIVTSIDNDHLDYYGDMERLQNAFLEFANRVPFYGLSIMCMDDPRCRRLLGKLKRRSLTYGFDAAADYSARNLRMETQGNSFEVYRGPERLGALKLRIPGRHNVQNALAAVAAGNELGIPFDKIAQALSEFQGVGRRLELRGEEAGVLVVDDYGHHPTEIRSTIAALRERWPSRRVVVFFQPHRYTRTQLLAAEFADAFEGAGLLWVLPIYAAGENPIPGVTSELILKALSGKAPGIRSLDPRRGLHAATAELKSGDVVLTLGAGDVWKLGEEILRGLKKVERALPPS